MLLFLLLWLFSLVSVFTFNALLHTVQQISPIAIQESLRSSLFSPFSLFLVMCANQDSENQNILLRSLP